MCDTHAHTFQVRVISNNLYVDSINSSTHESNILSRLIFCFVHFIVLFVCVGIFIAPHNKTNMPATFIHCCYLFIFLVWYYKKNDIDNVDDTTICMYNNSIDWHNIFSVIIVFSHCYYLHKMKAIRQIPYTESDDNSPSNKPECVCFVAYRNNFSIYCSLPIYSICMMKAFNHFQFKHHRSSAPDKKNIFEKYRFSVVQWTHAQTHTRAREMKTAKTATSREPKPNKINK